MKRSMIIILAAVMILTMAFSLTGCGSQGSGSDTPAPTEAQATEAQATEGSDAETGIAVDDTTFTYNGVSVALDAELEPVISALGDADDVKSELSCHGEGDDKTYTYGGFIVKSYPKDGVDRVLEVLINDAGIPTSKGIEVGSSLDDVIAAYGDVYTTIANKRYVYNAGGGKTLRFVVEDNAVVQIDYYFNV